MLSSRNFPASPSSRTSCSILPTCSAISALADRRLTGFVGHCRDPLGIIHDACRGGIIQAFDGLQQEAVRKKCSQLVRTMSQTLGGVAFTSVYGLCGDTFWDDLIDHAEVRDTYRYQEGVRLREGVVFSTLKYGGITFENYRGWIGGGTDAGDTVTPFIDPNEAHFFPLGTPNLFKTFFAPADYIETVNTLGLPRYAKAIPSDNNKSVRLEMQTNRSRSAFGRGL